MFGIGLPELILILAIALIVVGPDKLPDLARSVAKGIMELKKAAEGFKDSLNEEGGNPFDEIRPDLEEAAKAMKKHLLGNPEDDTTTFFPRGEGVNPPAENAANALEQIKQAGVDPGKPTVDDESRAELSADDTTPSAPPEEQTAEPDHKTASDKDSEHSKPRQQ